MTTLSSSTISETSTSATSSEDVTTTSSSTTPDVPTSTTSSEVVTESSSTTSTESSTVTSETSSSTTSADVSTTTSSITTSETSTSATATGPCATITGSYVLQVFGSTGDFAVDGNFAQLQNAFGSGYRVSFAANGQNAQQFRFQPDCTFTTADGGLLAMIGGTANLHYQYFFPSVQAASALVNVNWEADICSKNADNTLTCTAMQQSIFQTTSGETLLELGDQNYGEQITVNLVPVPGVNF
ncbi:hypothetical protein LQW54_010424 [Pestalotiopsis sp. IQ-011]